MVARWFYFLYFGRPCSVKFWYILWLWPFGIFYEQFVYFGIILNVLWSFGHIFPSFWYVGQEKSGNTASDGVMEKSL
jgi:hypothetical protein